MANWKAWQMICGKIWQVFVSIWQKRMFYCLAATFLFFVPTWNWLEFFSKIFLKSPQLDVRFHINNLDRSFFLGNNSMDLILLTFQLQTWTIVWCIEMDLQCLTDGSLPVFPILENLSLRILYSKTFKDVVCLCLEPERWAAVAVLWSTFLPSTPMIRDRIQLAA